VEKVTIIILTIIIINNTKQNIILKELISVIAMHFSNYPQLLKNRCKL